MRCWAAGLLVSALLVGSASAGEVTVRGVVTRLGPGSAPTLKVKRPGWETLWLDLRGPLTRLLAGRYDVYREVTIKGRALPGAHHRRPFYVTAVWVRYDGDAKWVSLRRCPDWLSRTDDVFTRQVLWATRIEGSFTFLEGEWGGKGWLRTNTMPQLPFLPWTKGYETGPAHRDRARMVLDHLNPFALPKAAPDSLTPARVVATGRPVRMGRRLVLRKGARSWRIIGGDTSRLLSIFAQHRVLSRYEVRVAGARHPGSSSWLIPLRLVHPRVETLEGHLLSSRTLRLKDQRLVHLHGPVTRLMRDRTGPTRLRVWRFGRDAWVLGVRIHYTPFSFTEGSVNSQPTVGFNYHLGLVHGRDSWTTGFSANGFPFVVQGELAGWSRPWTRAVDPKPERSKGLLGRLGWE